MSFPFEPARTAIRHSGNVVVVDLGGRVTVGEGAGLLRNTIKELVAADHKHVILNLRELTYVDSAGLGEMVGACTSVRNLGGDMKLVSPQPRIAHLLEMTKLSTLFAIFPDEAAAVQSF
jgi:anti-sigma B factor antagonist